MTKILFISLSCDQILENPLSCHIDILKILILIFSRLKPASLHRALSELALNNILYVERKIDLPDICLSPRAAGRAPGTYIRQIDCPCYN